MVRNYGGGQIVRKYTLEQIREFIACPEIGDDHYGKWGAMTREQRLVMNDLIEIAKEFEDSRPKSILQGETRCLKY